MSKDIRETVVLAAVALVEAVQLLIAAAIIMSYVPVNAADLPQQLLSMDLKDLKPEREIFLFRFFIVSFVGIFAALQYGAARRFGPDGIGGRAYGWLGAAALGVIIQVYWILLLWIYDVAPARHALEASAAAAYLIKLSWRWSGAWLSRLCVILSASRTIGMVIGREAAVAAFIVVAIYVPDVDAVVAAAFLQDTFYHINSFYMSPGWAYLTHNVLNVDTISLYSIVSPVVMARLAEWTGGFTYRHVMELLIAGGIIYFLACYVLLRCWLRSGALAVFGIIMAMKLQLFHPGVAAIVWRFPSATVIRYFFDMVFFLLLLGYLRRGNRAALVGASVVAGIALAYMADTGMYLLGALYVALGLLYWVNRSGPDTGGASQRWLLGPAVCPLAVACAVVWSLYGSHTFELQFWTRNMEYVRFFVFGFGSLPVYAFLKDKEVWAFGMAMLMPVVYGATIVIAGSLVLRRRIHRMNILPVVLSVYGLGLFHYFVNRSALTNHYAVIIPFVCIVCYWGDKVLDRLPQARRTWVEWGLVAAALITLFLNQLFVNYPNMMNIAGTDWSAVKQDYVRGADFAADAQLIQRWTKPGEKAVVIGSFATPLLMQAKRSPYFYYDPLFTSRPMDATVFAGGTYVHTKKALKESMAELEAGKSGIVFIERKMFVLGLPMPYYQAYEILALTVFYLRQNYEPVDEGKYFVALRRKAG